MRSRLPAFLLALCALAVAEARAAAPWSDQLVEGVREFSLTESAVQVDAQNRVHVFVGGDRVYHYWQDGGGWQSEVVDAHPRSGQRLRAAMGPGGEFHLIYDRIDLAPQSSQYSLFSAVTRRYATNLGGTWQLEEVPPPAGDSSTQYKFVTGLVVDASHQPRLLSFSNDSVTLRQDVFLQSRTAGGWTIERVNDDRQGHTATGFAASSQLAIDAAGRLHAIWFTANTPEQLVYAMRDGTGWHQELLASVGGTTLVPAKDPSSIQVDAAGTPHIVFINQTPAQDGYWHLVHLERAAGSWRLDDLGIAGTNHVTALDPAGRAHVVFSFPLGQDPNTGQDRFEGIHAQETDAGWTRESIAPAGPLDFWWNANLSLRVDGLGRPRVARLLDAFDSRAVALFQRDAGWTSASVASSGPVTFDNDYLLSARGSQVGADVRLALRGGLRSLVYRRGTRTGIASYEPVRAVEQPGGGFAVGSLPYRNTYGGVDPGSLAYGIATGGAEHTVFITGGLVQEALDDGNGPVQRDLTSLSSVVAHADRRPALALADGPFAALELLFQNGYTTLDYLVSGPVTLAGPIAQVPELIASQFRTGLALAPGFSDPPQYAAWVDMGNQMDVVRARYDGTAWSTEVVGRVPYDQFIGSHSLAVERDGTVHLAYERFTFSGFFGGYVPTGIAYGTNRCRGAFYTMDVDPFVVPDFATGLLGSRNPEIALDPNRNPHIAYRRMADRSLGYAHVHAGVFETETVVADTYSGEDSAIAVAADGTVSIAHHDPWGEDVSLATRAASPLEPTWDGCPPLPDPNAGLSGEYHLTTPPGALPLYDPGGEFEESFAPTRSVVVVSDNENGKLSVNVAVDSDGDDVLDATGDGAGKVSGNGRKVKVKRKVAVRDRFEDEPPDARLKLARSEQIDPVTRRRTIVETIAGKVDGRKVKLKRTSSDAVPAEALGMHLQLTITGSGASLAATGVWITRGGSFEVAGSGSWSPATHSAELRLRGRKIDIRLTGVRVWRTEADGVHLRADRFSVKGLGQKLKAVDLSGAW